MCFKIRLDYLNYSTFVNFLVHRVKDEPTQYILWVWKSLDREGKDPIHTHLKEEGEGQTKMGRNTRYDSSFDGPDGELYNLSFYFLISFK